MYTGRRVIYLTDSNNSNLLKKENLPISAIENNGCRLLPIHLRQPITSHRVGRYRIGHFSSSSFKTLNRKHLEGQKLSESACGLPLPHSPAAAQATLDKTYMESLLSTSAFEFNSNRNLSSALRKWSLVLFKPITNGAARELSAKDRQLWILAKGASKIMAPEATRHLLNASKANVSNGLEVEVVLTAKRMPFSSIATDLHKYRQQKQQRPKATSIKSKRESERQLRHRARNLKAIFLHMYGR